MRHLLAVAVLATGCVGTVGEEGEGPDGSTPAGKTGQTVYTRDVHAPLAKCSGGACHSTDAASGALGKFYAADASTAYSKLTGAPTIVGSGTSAFSSVAPVLSHIQAGHKGMTYTSDEISKITNWLSVEVNERKGATPSTPSVDPKQVLRDFSGCLTLADFNTAEMAPKWAALAASNNQKCLNCHQAGGDGFIVNGDAGLMFKVMSESSAYMLKFFSVDTSSSPAKVVVNTGSFTNAGVTIAGHPRFDPTNNAGMVALKAFYDLAAAKQAAGGCSPTPTIKD
ncbi:MAG TPA: hypothetical protein VK427_25085 [Kofleriaceae bacterium]|nr:hypothetical protein [Kofleriaceae bacterium]